ncbi:hypothetical protein MUP77_24115 [Candidatus Bathyarchaeota archaeon]|nr:hypothetical protein [Candidatus Bathyarchaeota archaeon]
MQNSTESLQPSDRAQSRSDNEYFKRSNEILYLFSSANTLDWPFISKIGVQKCLYLSEILSPLREIILSFLNFIYHHRGPYSKDVQNILDYLVSLNAIEVISFTTIGRNAYVDYRITEAGESLVNNLVLYPVEKEKFDWISTVMKVVDAYKGCYGLNEQYKGVDRIIDLVYQEPTFKEIRLRQAKWEIIPFGAENKLTKELINFLQTIEQELPGNFDKTIYKLNLATILLSFFEYLYVEHLSESQKNE